MVWYNASMIKVWKILDTTIENGKVRLCLIWMIFTHSKAHLADLVVPETTVAEVAALAVAGLLS